MIDKFFKGKIEMKGFVLFCNMNDSGMFAFGKIVRKKNVKLIYYFHILF